MPTVLFNHIGDQSSSLTCAKVHQEARSPLASEENGREPLVMSEVLLYTEHQGHLGNPTPQTLTEQDLGQPLGLLLDGMNLLFIQPPSVILPDHVGTVAHPDMPDGRRTHLYLGTFSQHTEGPDGA